MCSVLRVYAYSAKCILSEEVVQMEYVLTSNNFNIITSDETNRTMHQDKSDENSRTIYDARKCTCTNADENISDYCIIQDDETQCDLFTKDSPYIACYKVSGLYRVATTVWPFSYIMSSILFLLLLQSHCGKHAFNFMLVHTCCRNMNARIVDQTITNERRTRARMRTMWMRAADMNTEGNQKTILILKTKIYKENDQSSSSENEEEKNTAELDNSKDIDDNFKLPESSDAIIGKKSEVLTSLDEESQIFLEGNKKEYSTQEKSCTTIDSSNPLTTCKTESHKCLDENNQECSSQDDAFSADSNIPTCTICMNEIVSGNKVGDLSCRHIFHKECLKEWILWRNVCPLCQIPNIASTRVRSISPNEDDNEISGNNDENSRNSHSQPGRLRRLLRHFSNN